MTLQRHSFHQQMLTCLCLRSKPYKLIDYLPELKCEDCKRQGLIRYTLVKRCKHVVCIFCVKEHSCL